MSESLIGNIEFINLSNGGITLFEWKPPNSFKSFILDIKTIRKENTMDDIFFHVNKGPMKIVQIKKGPLELTTGGLKSVQFQCLEALLEIIHQKFNKIYDIKTILSYGNVSENIFSGFKVDIEEILTNFHDLGVVKKVDVLCRVCGKVLPLYIKKNVILESEDFPVPIVYSHRGHAIVCYIDQQFKVRGVELVNITG